MVRGNRPEEPALSEAAGTSVVPTSGRGNSRLSGSLSQLILQAFESCANARKILSLLAIKKSLTEAGYAMTKNNQRLKRELCNLVSHGLLIRVSGSGASGSFRLNSSQARRSGRAEPGQKKKAMTPKKSPARKREPQKKPRKKQPAVSKPKGPQSSVKPGKKQLKRPTKPVTTKKTARKRN